MPRRQPQHHSPVVKLQVRFTDIKDDKTITELTELFDAYSNQITQ